MFRTVPHSPPAHLTYGFVMRTILMLTLSGCSFTTHGVDRSWTVRDGPPDCTDSYALPILDGLGAGVLAGAGGALLDHDEGGAGLGAMSAALVLAVAAIVGEQRVAHCRQAQLVYAGASQ
jgi:hypothetical protein